MRTFVHEHLHRTINDPNPDKTAKKWPRADFPQVLFVSVDPKRDNPAKLEQYVHYFNKNFTGITGTEQELQKLAKSLNIMYHLEKADKQGQYLVGHSSSILLINPKTQLIASFSSPHSSSVIIEKLLQIIAIK